VAATVLNIGIASSLALFLIGSFFVWHYGAGIVPIGITGLLLITTYTGWINRHPLICLLAPGLGFGFLMVAGTQFVLQGQYSALAWQLGVIPFFLVNNLLLLNQYPDIRADAEAGGGRRSRSLPFPHRLRHTTQQPDLRPFCAADGGDHHCLRAERFTADHQPAGTAADAAGIFCFIWRGKTWRGHR